MKMSFRALLGMTVLLTAFSTPSLAQDFINDDFLDNIENNAKTLWYDNTTAFASAAPDKYKTESAVVMGFKRSVTIDKKSRMGFLSRGERSLIFFENVHFKIQLNDRNAVRSFTEVYFRYSDKVDGFSAKVTKPDGVVDSISLNEAVSVESISDVPEFYKSFFDQQNGGQRRYFKVAIPNLQPGDLLEYVAVTKSKLDVAGTGYIEFTPIYEICNKKYPILFNQIAIETDDKSYFKSLSLNGAPKFEKQPASESGFFRYVFTDRDRGVEKDVNFINPYQVYPLTKFQVVYSNNDKIKGALIGQVGEIKSGFSKEELAKKAWEDYEQSGSAYVQGYFTAQNIINEIWAEFKKQGAKDWTEKEYIKNAYYRLRNYVLGRDSYLSDKMAAYIFGSLLYQREIKSELIISISNDVGKLNDVLFDQEIRYVVKVNNDYYFNCTDFSNPGDLVDDLLASEAYIISQPTKSGSQDIKPIVLPDATPADNTANYTINASLSADMNTLSVSRTNAFTGISKSRNISTALKFTPYMLDDHKYYGGNSPTEKMRGSQVEEYDKSVKALKDQFKEAKPDYVKGQLQDEYHQKVKYRGFTVASDGRSLKNKDLVYTEEFDLPGMVRKAGKKYLVNIAGLVGSQLQLRKEERERKYDINVGYAKTYNWTINFKIPAGYTVEGIKELNTTVDNETGTYTAVAEEQAGTVVLKIKKIYKKANISKDKWSSMLQFIDMAYNNSYKNLLLKPQ